MFEVIRSWFVKILVKIAPFIFRWIYSHEKLVGLINVTISSENDGVVINCSELSNAVAWIEVTNFSPVKEWKLNNLYKWRSDLVRIRSF